MKRKQKTKQSVVFSSNRTTVSCFLFPDISFSFLFFLIFSVFSASNESMDNRGGSYFFKQRWELLEDKSRETGTLCWSEISTAKQSSGVFLKKDIQSVGAATGSLDNPVEPAAGQSSRAISRHPAFWLAHQQRRSPPIIPDLSLLSGSH